MGEMVVTRDFVSDLLDLWVIFRSEIVFWELMGLDGVWRKIVGV